MWIDLGIMIALYTVLIALQVPLLMLTILPMYDRTGERSLLNESHIVGKILCVCWVVLLSCGWFILDMCLLEAMELI